MRLITLGLGGSGADFLRLGFGAAAAQAEDTVHGGFRQWRPAVLGKPVPMDVDVVSRVRLRLRVRGRTTITRTVRSRAAAYPLPMAATARARCVRTATNVGLVIRGANAVVRVARGGVCLRALPAALMRVRANRASAVRVRCVGNGRTTAGRALRSRAAVAVGARADVATITRAAHRSRVGVVLRATAVTEASTLIGRVAEADRRDIELIALLVRQE